MDTPGIERKALFITEEDYNEMRSVPAKKIEATNFLEVADRTEAL